MPLTLKHLMQTATAAIPSLTPAEAQTLMANPTTLVLDVRDPSELAATGKIPGAINISRGMLEFRADPTSPSHNPALAAAKTLILYCASGGRAILAAKTLQDMGYTNIHTLGALKDWIAAGGATEA